MDLLGRAGIMADRNPKLQAAKREKSDVVAIIHHALECHYARLACLPANAFTEASPAVTLQATVWHSPVSSACLL